MNKKMIVGGIVLLIAVAGGSFYGGMVYARSARTAGFAGGNFTGGTFTGGQFTGARGAGARGGAGGGIGGGAGATIGQIISKDATSITVKMTDGSTKIILVGDSTTVAKQASGTADDLTVGTTVVVTGTVNSDKSVTATSIQIRPQTPTDAAPTK